MCALTPREYSIDFIFWINVLFFDVQNRLKYLVEHAILVLSLSSTEVYLHGVSVARDWLYSAKIILRSKFHLLLM